MEHKEKIAVQINGVMIDSIAGREITKTVVVPSRLVNIILEPKATSFDNEVERVWDEFWVEGVEILNADGTVDMDQVKKELYDFKIMMDKVSKVYDEITNGKFSKPNTDPEHIIGEVEDRIDIAVYEAEAGEDL